MTDAQASPDIDIVIMWVDGADAHFKAIHDEAYNRLVGQGVPVKSEKGRHRDNGELFFLLRAIAAYMPWYRRIHIVTNGQVPRFVDFARDDIALVTHAQIFPRAADAPSFNTFAIESAINGIPGLAEHYIRFSDDFFVGAPLTKDDFLGPDGQGVFHFGGEFFNIDDTAYHRTLQHNAVRFWKTFGYMPMVNTLHVPQLRRRGHVQAMLAQWKGWFSRTQANRFRTTEDAIGLFLYPYFTIQQYLGGLFPLFVESVFAKQARAGNEAIYRQVNLGNESQDWRNRLANIGEDRPRYFNLNDNIGARQMPEVVASVSALLYRLFPGPSPYEKVGAPLPPFASGKV